MSRRVVGRPQFVGMAQQVDDTENEIEMEMEMQPGGDGDDADVADELDAALQDSDVDVGDSGVGDEDGGAEVEDKEEEEYLPPSSRRGDRGRGRGSGRGRGRGGGSRGGGSGRQQSKGRKAGANAAAHTAATTAAARRTAPSRTEAAVSTGRGVGKGAGRPTVNMKSAGVKRSAAAAGFPLTPSDEGNDEYEYNDGDEAEMSVTMTKLQSDVDKMHERQKRQAQHAKRSLQSVSADALQELRALFEEKSHIASDIIAKGESEYEQHTTKLNRDLTNWMRRMNQHHKQTEAEWTAHINAMNAIMEKIEHLAREPSTRSRAKFGGGELERQAKGTINEIKQMTTMMKKCIEIKFDI